MLCSLLRTGYIYLIGTDYSSNALVHFGYDNAAFEYNVKKGIDMSKISQISFKAFGQTHDGCVRWMNDSTSTSTNFSGDNSFSISAPSGDNSRCAFLISTTNSLSCTLKVTSFTTTDGKVHTADNLNY